MDVEIAGGQLGPEAKYDVKIVGSSLKAELAYTGKLGAAGFMVDVPVIAVLEAIKVAIPGGVDDVVINGLEALLQFYGVAK